MITNFFLIPALFSILIGSLLLFFAIRNKKKRKALINEGKKAKGVIINNIQNPIGEKTYYFSIVKVQDPSEGALELKMKFGLAIPRTVGSEIEIVYDVNNRSDVFEYTNSISWANTVFYIVGIMFIIGGSIGGIIAFFVNYFVNSIE